MDLKLKNHQLWQQTAKIIAQIDVNAIGKQHLENCNYTVNGYWDESEFYEEITFVGSLSTELISSSLGITIGEPDDSR